MTKKIKQVTHDDYSDELFELLRSKGVDLTNVDSIMAALGKSMGNVINKALEVELNEKLDNQKYQRTDNKNYRNGYTLNQLKINRHIPFNKFFW